jgi:predicted phage tail protein
MIRNIKLHGSLAKAADEVEMKLDVDTQHELFAALRARSSKLDMALRKAGNVALIATDVDGEDARSIRDGFRFGDKAANIAVVAQTEGAYFIPAIVWWAVAIMAVVQVATTMLMSHVQTNANGSGGAKDTIFNGATNSTDQGGPIPVIYGKKCLVGSTIIAADESFFNTV